MRESLRPLEGVVTIGGRREDGEVVELFRGRNLVVRTGLRLLLQQPVSAWGLRVMLGQIAVGSGSAATLFSQTALYSPLGVIDQQYVHTETIDQGDTLARAVQVQAIVSAKELADLGISGVSIREIGLMMLYTPNSWETLSTTLFARAVIDPALVFAGLIEYFVTWRLDFIYP